MIKELVYILIILLGIPVGLFLAKTCKDEIKAWRKTLKIMIAGCLIIGLALFFINFEYKIPAILTLGWMIITFLIIVWKSYNIKL